MPLPLHSLADFRAAARRRLPRLAFDFIDGGADGEHTLRANEAAFARRTFSPRYLVDVSDRSTDCVLFGQRYELPLLIAPTGMAKIAGPGGERAGASAARRAGIGFTLSTMSSDSIERVAEAGGRLWFQLYLWNDRGLVERFVTRAAAAGYSALVVTVDVPVIGNRLRDGRNGFVFPPRLRPHTAWDMLRHPRWLAGGPSRLRFGNVETAVDSGSGPLAYARLVNRLLANPAADWTMLSWIRDIWSGPLLVKGILSAEDAQLAAAHGADGVIVSNHGGRQLDGAPATLDVLAEVVAAVPALTVLLDGGVRRGSDLVTALALGANAVLMGRPWLFGLATGGEDGVLQVIEILRAELDRTLALIGRRSVHDIGPEVIRPPVRSDKESHPNVRLSAPFGRDDNGPHVQSWS